MVKAKTLPKLNQGEKNYQLIENKHKNKYYFCLELRSKF
tara:strand:- start:264 stop:380 length:117 start_codon:yes stop_codon:yes gene_type:complete